MMAPDKLIQTFDACVLGWAEGQFTRELQSGFARLRQFDGADCREILDILEQQPRKQLEELAKALPLGAFWEHPQDIEKRRHLPESQRQAVENLRTIYDQRYREHFSEHVERIRESRSASALKQFKHAAKKGTRLVNGIASQWGWNVATAAPGEWGLILNEPHFRTTVSLNLGRDLSLYYHVSLFDEIHSRSVRFRDDYLKVLGLGQGCWKIERIECLPEKLVHASEFAFWHVGEYQGILKSILSVEPGSSGSSPSLSGAQKPRRPK